MSLATALSILVGVDVTESVSTAVSILDDCSIASVSVVVIAVVLDRICASSFVIDADGVITMFVADVANTELSTELLVSSADMVVAVCGSVIPSSSVDARSSVDSRSDSGPTDEAPVTVVDIVSPFCASDVLIPREPSVVDSVVSSESLLDDFVLYISPPSVRSDVLVEGVVSASESVIVPSSNASVRTVLSTSENDALAAVARIVAASVVCVVSIVLAGCDALVESFCPISSVMLLSFDIVAVADD